MEMAVKHRFKKPLTLLDVVRIVSQFSRNEHESSLVVADLVNRGYVKLGGRYHNRRIVIR